MHLIYAENPLFSYSGTRNSNLDQVICLGRNDRASFTQPFFLAAQKSITSREKCDKDLRRDSNDDAFSTGEAQPLTSFPSRKCHIIISTAITPRSNAPFTIDGSSPHFFYPGGGTEVHNRCFRPFRCNVGFPPSNRDFKDRPRPRPLARRFILLTGT